MDILPFPVEEKIQDLFEQDFMVVFYLNGAYRTITDFLYIPGASKKVLEARIPFSKSASKPLYSPYIKPGSTIVQEAAIGLSIAALLRSIELNTNRLNDILNNPALNLDEINIYRKINTFVGVGTTADYNSGTCIVCISVYNNGVVKSYIQNLTMTDEEKINIPSIKRKERDDLFSHKLLDYLYNVMNMPPKSSDLPDTINKNWINNIKQLLTERMKTIDKTPAATKQGGRKRYDSMTVAELKEKAKSKSIKYSGLTKSELIAQLRKK
jgi:hypothetical protein